MKRTDVLTYAPICISLLLIPGGLTYYFTTYGAPASGSLEMTGIGLVALLPGFLMGGAALWVAAQG